MNIQILKTDDFAHLANEVERYDDDEQEYSTWLNYGKEFSPTLKLKVCKKLPNGAYKVAWDNNRSEYIVIPVDINTDEIYDFSNSTTSVILNEVKTFWERADIYSKHNFIHKRGLLLEGPAGNSKTSTINLLIKQLINSNGLVFVVNTIKEFSLLGEFLSDALRKIEKDRPVITIIEDIDQMIAAAGCDQMFLDFLDGKHSIDHHLVIMTSNNTSDLSEAMLRPSRIDMRFVLEVPDKQIRREYLQKKGIAEDKLDEYAEKTEGMSFAQLKEVFIGTEILGKDIDKVVNQILNPQESKDYLSNKSNQKIGL